MDGVRPVGPNCMNCNKQMRYARTSPARDGRQELHVYECSSCHITESYSESQPMRGM
jgi:hypothetical protein